MLRELLSSPTLMTRFGRIRRHLAVGGCTVYASSSSFAATKRPVQKNIQSWYIRSISDTVHAHLTNIVSSLAHICTTPIVFSIRSFRIIVPFIKTTSRIVYRFLLSPWRSLTSSLATTRRTFPQAVFCVSLVRHSDRSCRRFLSFRSSLHPAHPRRLPTHCLQEHTNDSRALLMPLGQAATCGV